MHVISLQMATYIVATLTSQLNPTGIQYLCSQDEKLLAALLTQLASMVSLYAIDSFLVRQNFSYENVFWTKMTQS